MSAVGGPNFIDNGLVLYLDPASRNSYPGSGTTWFDRSGNRNNGTFINGISYSSDNAGTLIFNGTSQYVTLPSNLITGLTSSSFGLWFKYFYNGDENTIFSFGSDSLNYMAFTTNFVITGNPSLLLRTTAGSSIRVGTNVISQNTWYNYVFTFDTANLRIYRNGVLQSVGATSLTPNSLGSAPNNYISFPQTGVGGPLLNGFMSSFYIYNRTLSADEILQNYNTTKGRFGL